jgi:hypothetical protein
MSTTRQTARPYRGNDHLWSTVTTDAGTLAVWPLDARRLHFDAAMANHLPMLREEGQHGSTVLDIGRGARVRVSGNAEFVGGAWEITHLSVRRDVGGDATRTMEARAEALVFDLVNDWAKTHAADIAQADDIARNNGARALEETIAKHETALAILREQLSRCEDGESSWTEYPDVPTKGR